MKKWALGIIVFLSVTFIIGISSVNAEEHDFSKWIDISGFHLPNNISVDNNYVVIWKRGGNAPGGYRMVYWPKTSTNVKAYAPLSQVTNINSFPYTDYINFFNGTSWFSLNYYQTNSNDDYYFPNSSSGSFASFNVGAGGYLVYSNINITLGSPTDSSGNWFDIEWLNSPFNITYEQGEVLLANYDNAIANLVTMRITSTNASPLDYTFSYSTDIGGSGGFRDSQVFEPTCTENMENGDINYSCYYNIPLLYNTTLNFTITDNSTNEEIYNQDYTAYLDSLVNGSDYNVYILNPYKYANISDILSGKFGISENINGGVKIYVSDISNNTNIDFLTSQYYIDTNIRNGIKYYQFDFGSNTNLYITIEILNDELYNDSTIDYYLLSPSNAYTHLSGMPVSEETQSNPVNQQAYKDSQGNITYKDNPIVYYEYGDNFYNDSKNVFSQTIDFVKGVTMIFTDFVTSLNPTIQNTIYTSFIFILIFIVIMLFKH